MFNALGIFISFLNFVAYFDAPLAHVAYAVELTNLAWLLDFVRFGIHAAMGFLCSFLWGPTL